MRIRCLLWGCECAHDYPACLNCGAALYESEFIQIGKLSWIWSAYRAIREAWGRLNRRCDVCRKRMWLAGRANCCSQKCYDEWIPF